MHIKKHFFLLILISFLYLQLQAENQQAEDAHENYTIGATELRQLIEKINRAESYNDRLRDALSGAKKSATFVFWTSDAKDIINYYKTESKKETDELNNKIHFNILLKGAQPYLQNPLLSSTSQATESLVINEANSFLKRTVEKTNYSDETKNNIVSIGNSLETSCEYNEYLRDVHRLAELVGQAFDYQNKTPNIESVNGYEIQTYYTMIDQALQHYAGIKPGDCSTRIYCASVLFAWLRRSYAPISSH